MYLPGDRDVFDPIRKDSLPNTFIDAILTDEAQPEQFHDDGYSGTQCPVMLPELLSKNERIYYNHYLPAVFHPWVR